MSKPIENAREQLLSEGRKKLFAAGYAGLSVADLAKSCGMAAGTFYSYFKSKNDFALAVVDEDWQRVLSAVDADIDSDDTLHDKLLRIDNHVAGFREDLEKIYLRIPIEPEESLRRRKERLRDIDVRVKRLIECEIAAGRIDGARVSGDDLTQLIMDHLISTSNFQLSSFDDFIRSLRLLITATPEPARNQEHPHLRGQGLGRLERNLAEYDMLMESTRVCVARIRLDEDLTIEWCNDIFFDAIGYTEEEYGRQFNWKMRAYYHDYEDQIERLRGMVAETIAAGKTRFEIIMDMPTKTDVKTIQGTGTLIDFVDGEPTMLYAVYSDITETVETRKRLEKAEREAEKAEELESENMRLSKMIDGIPTGLAALREVPGKPRYFSFNRYFVERVALPKEVLKGKEVTRFFECLHPDDRERCRKDYRALIAAGGSATGIYRFLRKQGKDPAWVLVRGQVHGEPGGERLVYFVYMDIDERIKAQQALEHSRALYQNAVNTTRLIMWEYDIRAHRITMSDDPITEAERVRFNWPSAFEDVPKSVLGIIEDEDQAKMTALYEQVDAGENATADLWFKMTAGQGTRCERITYTVVKDEQGNPLTAYGIGQNITAEKKVQERYENEKRFLQQNNDYDLVAKGHYNLTKNQVLEYELANKDLFGVPEGSTYNQACADFFTMTLPEERGAVENALDRECLLRRYQRGQMQSNVEYRRVLHGAPPVWVSLIIHTYMMPDTGDVECFTYAYDITAKKRNDEILGIIAGNDVEYVGLIYAPTGKFEFVVKQSSVRYARVGEKVSYAGCCDFVSSHFVDIEERANFERATSLDDVLDTLRRTGRCVTTYQRTEGESVRCMQLNFTWLDEPSETIIIVRTDVTAAYEREQRRLREVQEAKLEADKANEAKSSFLSSMSHDIRTPLNGIIGFTDFALRENDPKKQRDYLEKVKSSSELLLDLVNDTLDVSRIESGKMTLELEPGDPGELARGVITALRPTAELKHIDIQVDANIPTETVMVDKLKFQKVFLNLLSNAIKYTPEGGTVQVAARILDPEVDGCNREIVIQDNGIGMTKEFQERMFEPFAQEQRSEAANVTGTGLGLAIVKRIVDMSGGVIKVDSKVGKGTRFTVEMRLRVVAENAVVQAQQEKSEKSLQGRHVLLCEDNALNTEIAVMMLKERGVSADCAVNGREGLEKFEASRLHGYDAILMDVHMPVMDGREATQAIRELDRADAATVPIIALTADAFDEDIRKNRAIGMNYHVTKPIDASKLYAALAEATSGE